MSQPKLGLQLIIYGDRTRQDLPGVLREVKEIGYAGIETGNLFASHGEKEVLSLLEETGLAVAGAHFGYADAVDPEKVRANIAYLQAVGARYYIVSGVAPGGGLEAYEQAARTFNHLGELCRVENLVFCYHNHAFEFELFEHPSTAAEGSAAGLTPGQPPQDRTPIKGIHRLCELTDPELVKLCVDVYWVTIGGEAPEEFIARYRDRAVYFHFKDGAPGQFTELGRGTVNLPAAARAAAACQPEWIICEQDRTDKTPALSSAESLAYLKQLGF
jgi:sugar phosphate isomerase/epimerase